jgi:hypothetical protein
MTLKHHHTVHDQISMVIEPVAWDIASFITKRPPQC